MNERGVIVPKKLRRGMAILSIVRWSYSLRLLAMTGLVVLLNTNPALAATVVGTVYSSAAGDPLLGVEILVEGVAMTETDLKGVFRIEAAAGDIVRAVKPDYVGIAAVIDGTAETLTFTLAPIWPLIDVEQVYADVPAGSWYAAAVKNLYEEQVLSVSQLKPYRPGDSLTRAELAHFAVLAAGFLPPDVPRTNFCDVIETAWYAPAVEFMYGQEWIGGYSTLLCGKGKDFRPGNPITRAEAVKMVLGVFGDLVVSKLAKTECKSAGFSDVSTADWFAPFVEQAACLGMVSGYADGTFHPGRSVNRAEIAVILSNTLKALRDN